MDPNVFETSLRTVTRIVQIILLSGDSIQGRILKVDRIGNDFRIEYEQGWSMAGRRSITNVLPGLSVLSSSAVAIINVGKEPQGK